MPLDDLLDLIADVQAITRKEANVSTYNPGADLSHLTPFCDAIPLLEPSPDCVRCLHCKGPLLNGVRSVICVFCGTVPKQRLNTVNFSSTIGRGWLLDSLHLNGSEACELPNEEATQAGSVKNLSNLLELEVQWTAPLAKSIIGEKFLGGFDLGGVCMSFKESNVGSFNEKEDGWEADFQFLGGPDSVESQRVEAGGNKDEKFDIFPVPSLNTIDSRESDMVFDGKQGENIKSTASINFGEDEHEQTILNGGIISASEKHDLMREASKVDWFEEGDGLSNGDSEAMARVSAFSTGKSRDDISSLETTQSGDELERVMSQMHDLSFMLQPKFSPPQH